MSSLDGPPPPTSPAPEPPPTCHLLTLLTDFGTRDGYVASMKGTAYAASPRIRVEDITHEVTGHDIFRAAIILEQVAPTFPPGTVHVVVVDPGVGTQRKPLAVECNEQIFVGPDNGVLALAAAGPRRIFEIQNPSLMRPTLSDTFHGRDLFAPVGAHLACGTPIEQVGPELPTMLELPLPQPVFAPNHVDAEVIYADQYGNLMLNVHAHQLEGIDRDTVQTHIGGFAIDGLSTTYGDVAIGELVVYVGSSGFVEVARREGNARHYLGAPRGTRVRIDHAAVER